MLEKKGGLPDEELGGAGLRDDGHDTGSEGAEGGDVGREDTDHASGGGDVDLLDGDVGGVELLEISHEQRVVEDDGLPHGEKRMRRPWLPQESPRRFGEQLC